MPWSCNKSFKEQYHLANDQANHQGSVQSVTMETLLFEAFPTAHKDNGLLRGMILTLDYQTNQ